jgi:mRNA-degrading endonuclease RelE of RelBE toxin-antitoxin system
MPYEIRYDADAVIDLTYLTKREQVIVRLGVPVYLGNDPALEAGAREPMRPNTIGTGWALHLGALRVYYDIDEEQQRVHVRRVGRKPRNILYLRNQPFDLG